MPIYEYRCESCGKRSSVLVRSISAQVAPACEHCGSVTMTRLLSRFAVHRAGGGFDLDNPDAMAGLEDDPRAMARWARQMQEESGEDMGPEFDDMVQRIESGEDPEAVMGAGDDEGEGAGFDDF